MASSFGITPRLAVDNVSDVSFCLLVTHFFVLKAIGCTLCIPDKKIAKTIEESTLYFHILSPFPAWKGGVHDDLQRIDVLRIFEMPKKSPCQHVAIRWHLKDGQHANSTMHELSLLGCEGELCPIKSL